MGKSGLVALLNSWCLVMVEWLFLAVPWGCLQFVIVVFPDHTHYCKMGNFCVVQFSRYFTVSHEPGILKSAKYFPSLTNCLFAFIQSNDFAFICYHKTSFFIE